MKHWVAGCGFVALVAALGCGSEASDEENDVPTSSGVDVMSTLEIAAEDYASCEDTVADLEACIRDFEASYRSYVSSLSCDDIEDPPTIEYPESCEALDDPCQALLGF